MPRRKPWGGWKIWAVQDFSGGLNVRSADADRKDNEASDLWNVLFTDNGRPQKRGGSVQINTSPLPGIPRGLCWWRPTASKSFLFTVCTNSGILGELGYVDVSTGAYTSIGTGLATTGQPSMVAFASKLIIADGAGAPWFYDYVNSKFGQLGITVPAGAPVAADSGSAGNLNGTNYQWVYTSVRYDGSESNASPLSGVLSLTNHSASLTGIAVSADPLVTARNIYRVGGTLSNWFQVGTLADNTTTVFTDNVADSTADQNAILRTTNGVPPTISAVAVYHDRLWGIGDLNNPSRLAWTDLLLPSAWGDGTFYQDFNPDYGAKLTGLGTSGPRLVVSKAQKAYYFYGDPPANFIVDEIRAPDGTWSQGSMAFAESVLVYLGSVSFVETDGISGQILSDDQDSSRWNKVEPLVTNVVRGDVVSAVYYNRLYLCSLVSNYLTANMQQVLVFDFRMRAWSRFDWAVNAWATDDQGNLYFASASSNYVLQALVGTSDPSNAGIHFRWASKDFDFGQPLYRKRLGSTWIEMDLTSANPTLTVSADEATYQQMVNLAALANGVLQWDGSSGTTWDTTVWADTQSPEVRTDWPPAMTARHFRFTLDETSTNALAVTQVSSRWLPVRIA